MKKKKLNKAKAVEDYQHPKKAGGWKKFRSYREGKEAAKQGRHAGSCPYDLDDESKKILLQRDRWLRGWEEQSYKELSTKKRLKFMKKKLKVVSGTHGYGPGYTKFEK